jgi:hypothetical protein
MSAIDRAALVDTAVKLILGKTDGQPYEVRKRATLIIGAARGHKFKLDDAKEDDRGFSVPCANCGQIVKALVDGTGVEGRAVENDCPTAAWRRPA